MATFELSQVHALNGQAPTAIRILPRAPVDRAHEYRGRIPEQEPEHIIHVIGGHTTVGEELAGLDLAGLEEKLSEVPPGLHYVVTGVGALMNPAHELAVGRLLFRVSAPASVGYSHTFFASSFATRERTTLVNSRLLPRASALSTKLATTTRRAFPNARPYLATNDGCSTPLAQLALTPVHSLFSARPASLVGAGAVVGTTGASLAVACDDEPFVGIVKQGLPQLEPRFYRLHGAELATKGANLNSWTSMRVSRTSNHQVVAESDHAPVWVDPDGERLRVTSLNLASLGAATAPVVAWTSRLARVATEADFLRELSVSESDVRARLVADGFDYGSVSIIESRAEATTFDHPNVVALRVRAAAGLVPKGF